MQQVEPLCCQLTAEKVDPCQVAAWPGEAGDKTKLYRVFGGNKGDRDRRGCCLGNGRREGRACGDYGDLSANQFGRQLRQSIVLVLGEAVDDCYVLALHIADVFEAQAECAQTVHHRVRRSGVKEPNHGHRRLLRARRKRQCCCRHAANKRDELAPPHSITSSASCWSLSGTSRPSALAVLRLMTNSNLVGCSTGNSAGLAPRMTLATIWPVCHHIRERLGPYERSPPASACSFH